MAKRTMVLLADDIDGTETSDVETVRFSLEGSFYEIDLNRANQLGLHEALKPYIAVARRTTQPSKNGAAKKKASNPGDIRMWARKNGIPISDRGRIPSDIQQHYLEAHRA